MSARGGSVLAKQHADLDGSGRGPNAVGACQAGRFAVARVATQRRNSRGPGADVRAHLLDAAEAARAFARACGFGHSGSAGVVLVSHRLLARASCVGAAHGADRSAARAVAAVAVEGGAGFGTGQGAAGLARTSSERRIAAAQGVAARAVVAHASHAVAGRAAVVSSVVPAATGCRDADHTHDEDRDPLHAAPSIARAFRSRIDLFLCAFMLVLGACDSSSHDTEACDPGDERACTCAGTQGSQLCRPDGTFAPCSCTREVARDCGSAGEERACRCAGGGSGVQVCKADGLLSACRCERPATQVESRATTPSAEPDSGPRPAERCCGDRGSCVASSALVAADRGKLGRFECGDIESVCLPDVVASEPEEPLATCRSLGNVEGRCVPDCVVGDATGLPRANCDAHEHCAPCFNPTNGVATGVCELAKGDAPDDPPVLFGRCCDDRGSCVPSSRVPDAARAKLGADRCDAARELLCLPDSLADSPEPPTCSAFDRSQGRCLPACLPAFAGSNKPWLVRSDCAEGALCVPCQVMGQSTGACGSP